VATGLDLELVRDLEADSASSFVGAAAALAGDLYVPLNLAVYRTAGSPESTRHLVDSESGFCEPYTADLRPLAGRMLIGTGPCTPDGALWSYEPSTDARSLLFGAARPERPRFWKIANASAEEADLLVGISEGPQLWTTDGTEAGTVFRIPISAGVGGVSRLGEVRFLHDAGGLYRWSPGDPEAVAVESDDQGFAPVGIAGGRAIFVAQDFAGSEQHLVAIGPDGPALRLAALEAEGFFLSHAELDDRILLLVLRADRSYELWATDGTPAGTGLVRDLGQKRDFLLTTMVPLGDRLAFLRSPSPVELELWASDGTAAGTERLDRVAGATTSTFARAIVSTGDRIFVLGSPIAQDGTLLEERRLWASPDAEGAGVVVAEWPAPSDTAEHEVVWDDLLFPLGNRVFFAGASAGSGAELWASDGTPAGTGRVADIAPGPASSWPESFSAAGSRLYFTADDGLRGRELWSFDPSDASLCRPGPRSLCVAGERFRLEAFWTDFEGSQGDATAVPISADSGAFWFFEPANVELYAKVLDATEEFGHHWVFFGALSNVRYALTVRDGATGAARRYVNPAGRYASVGDTAAFGPLGASATAGPPPREELRGRAAPLPFARVDATSAAACQPGPARLCLLGERFAVEAEWRDFEGNAGVGGATPWPGGESGTFWFFDPANVELIVKVLDGTSVNGRYWLYYGALSNVEYRVTVTDTLTGTVRVYVNPPGTYASVGDVDAF
jgi:ELWxxDGT repeat protein